VVERNPYLTAGLLDSVHYLLAAGGVDGEGLLGDDVAAGAQRVDDVPVVRAVHRGDDDGARALIGKHAAEILRAVAGDRRDAEVVRERLVVPGHVQRVRVAETDQPAMLAMRSK